MGGVFLSEVSALCNVCGMWYVSIWCLHCGLCVVFGDCCVSV